MRPISIVFALTIAATGVFIPGCSKERKETVVVVREDQYRPRPFVVVEQPMAPPGAYVVVREAPPPVIREKRPPSPGPSYFWIDGHWSHNGKSFKWVSGRYELVRTGRAWAPCQWDHVRSGWAYKPGHWVAR